MCCFKHGVFYGFRQYFPLVFFLVQTTVGLTWSHSCFFIQGIRIKSVSCPFPSSNRFVQLCVYMINISFFLNLLIFKHQMCSFSSTNLPQASRVFLGAFFYAAHVLNYFGEKGYAIEGIFAHKQSFAKVGKKSSAALKLS